MTALAPPGPRSLAIVVNRCTRSASSSFMVEKSREGGVQGQACLMDCFQITIRSSPGTPDATLEFNLSLRRAANGQFGRENVDPTLPFVPVSLVRTSKNTASAGAGSYDT
jgi:hypothetical protein